MSEYTNRSQRTVRPARTPGMAEARRMFAAHAESERRGMPVDEILGGREGVGSKVSGEGGTHTRRGFLLGGAGLLAGAAVAASPVRSAAKTALAGTPRIAIVGGGLSGLRCAHLLWTGRPARPIASTVYEANPERAGGRCWTLRGFFNAGLITEHGGAFIDSNQVAIRRLAARLGLQEELVIGGGLSTGEDIYWIDGAYYTRAEATADWHSIGYPAFQAASREVSSPAGEKRLDSMSVPEWLDGTDIGSASRLGKLMLANAVAENGGDPEDQSALDLIELTVTTRSKFLPGDNVKYHIVGGNDQLVSRMIAQLPAGAVKYGEKLAALRENADRTLTLSFDAPGRTVDVVADYVVLALPFSTLRNVDLSMSGLSATKQTVIQTFGMGSNAKLHVEMQYKTWPALGFRGVAYSEWDRFCCAWDDSVALGPDARPALLLGFPGGRVGKSQLTGPAHGTAPASDLGWFLDEIEPVYPGTTTSHTGRAYEDHWALDPWVQGSYSYLRVGQASSYGAIAAATEGRVHFAGEHTSIANQGFLDGAVATGERAARQLHSRIGAGRTRA